MSGEQATTQRASGREPAGLAPVPGLAAAQAARLLEEIGPNRIPEPPPVGVAARVLRQLQDPMILLLLGAAVITVALRDLADSLVIGLVVVLNTAIGVVQELRAEHAVAALRRLAAPEARVVRDGADLVIPAEQVVPGDLVRVEAGDVVPADARLVEAVRLQVDEAALTGESVPVDKDLHDPFADTLAAGTVVTRGRGAGLVTATGPLSALGRIAGLVAAQAPRPTPLQQRLTALGRALTVVVLVLCAVTALLGLLQGRPLGQMVVTAVSLAVAAVPESLPAVVTLALALGARRMARRSAVVRRLPAVETLGSVTVIAADKTGTLTEGRMRAEALWIPPSRPSGLSGQPHSGQPHSGRFAVTGHGYAPHGVIAAADGQPDGGTPGGVPAGVERLLRDVVLCNDADVRRPDGAGGEWRPLGDPQEAALVALAAKGGVDPARTRARHPRCLEVPFDSSRRRMTTVHHSPQGGDLVVCKGAPEVLLGLPGLLAAGQDAELAALRDTADELAAQGYRLLAVADRYASGPVPADDAERDLRIAGLIAITDPPRRGASGVVESFRAAGITVLMITGDHPATASAIASRVGIDHDATVVGDGLVPGDGPDGLTGARVYARIRPEQKLDIVRAWQEAGHVVAMTGDGVNDAPALRRADIGVAMGGSGTEVARQAADLVLLDDDLGTVATAITEGRRIYTNVRRFLRYALSGGAAEVLVMVLGPFLGLGVPLLPSQILWVNMLTHGLPGVAFGAEPAEPDIMRQPPRSPQESVFGAGLARQVAATGCLMAAVVLAVATWTAARGGPWQTMAFVVLGLAQLGVAVALRSRGADGGRWRFLDLAVAGAAVLQLAPCYLPPLQALLGTEPLAPPELLLAGIAALVPGSVLAAARRRRRRLHG